MKRRCDVGFVCLFVCLFSISIYRICDATSSYFPFNYYPTLAHVLSNAAARDWDTADAEVLVPCAGNHELLNVRSLRPAVGLNIAVRTLPAERWSVGPISLFSVYSTCPDPHETCLCVCVLSLIHI